MVKYRPINVHLTNGTKNVESRFQLLPWINNTLQSNFKRFEELSNGAAYCQLLEMLFPGTIALNTVYMYTNLENESLANFKILQRAFRKLCIMRDMPIDRLAGGRYHDNLEFLQWFKKFFDANYDGRPYDPIVGRCGRPMGYGPSQFRYSRRKSQIRHKRSKSQTAKGCNRKSSQVTIFSNTTAPTSPMFAPKTQRSRSSLPNRQSTFIQTSSSRPMRQCAGVEPVPTNSVRKSADIQTLVDIPPDFAMFDVEFLDSVGIKITAEMTKNDLLKMLEEHLIRTKLKRDLAFSKLAIVEKMAMEHQVGPGEEFAKQILSVIRQTKDRLEAPTGPPTEPPSNDD